MINIIIIEYNYTLMKKKFFILISIISIILIPTILTEIYLKYIGLGNPIIL